MTLLGVVSLYYVYASFEDLALRFIPRFLFVIFVDIFSYFFLNLYRHSIFEIKYFQNELTNLDARLVALEGSLIIGDEKTVAKLCEALAKTERNFVLKKGEV